MGDFLNRRGFLAAVPAAAAAGALAASNANAIEPLARKHGPAFKFSLAAYSYRKLFNSEFTLSHFIDDCAKMGLEGAELTSYYFPADVKPAYLRQLKGECFRAGLSISGTAIRNDFGVTDAGKLKQEIAHVKQWIVNAEILSAPVIRIFAGHVPKNGDEEKTLNQMVECMQECCEFAGEHGVHLALENHGGPTATPAGLLKLVKGVDSPWFGVNLDTGNFHTEDVYADLAAVAPYAINVQVKVVTSSAGRKDKTPTDFARIGNILRTANYRGFVVLEYEEAGDPREESARFMQTLRRALT